MSYSFALGLERKKLKFTELSLVPPVMSAIEANKFVECTPIQEKTIPVVLSGHDVAGLAQTGTGKTAAFLLPLLDRLVRSRKGAEENAEGETPEASDASKARPIFKSWKDENFILVLVPTRELAEQVYQNLESLGQFCEVNAAVIYGGTSYDGQKAALKKGVQFIIATPGRMIDLYKEHLIDLSQVRAVVFDEADRMFDMGFKDDMKYVLQRIPKDRQFLVFSATLNFDVLNTAYEFGANPVEVNVSRDQTKAENVEDEIFHVGQDEKAKYLLSLLKKYEPKQAIIFSNFKHNVDRIAQFLSSNDIPAMGISSLLTQAQRTRVMELFRAENDRNILVATDVAARGLDIKGVDLVVNYEMPDDHENYVHRIGRTGRAGAKGKAFSLVSDRDVEALQRVENYLENKRPIGWMEDSEIVEDFKDFPREDFRKNFKANDRKPKGKSFSRDRQGRDGQRGGGQSRHPQRDRSHTKNFKGPKVDHKKRQGQDQEGRRPDSAPSFKKKGFKSKRSHPRQGDHMNGASPRPGKSSKNTFRSPKDRGQIKKWTHRPGETGASKPKKSAFAAKISGLFKKLFS